MKVNELEKRLEIETSAVVKVMARGVISYVKNNTGTQGYYGTPDVLEKYYRLVKMYEVQ